MQWSSWVRFIAGLSLRHGICADSKYGFKPSLTIINYLNSVQQSADQFNASEITGSSTLD
jgi:hypothetical protein